jgi:hypothetical protein
MGCCSVEYGRGLTAIFAFGAVEGEQLGVARQIVGPMAGEAALAFGAERAAQQSYDPAAA